jgi:hypothetical protein
MWKTVLAGATALAIAGATPAPMLAIGLLAGKPV